MTAQIIQLDDHRPKASYTVTFTQDWTVVELAELKLAKVEDNLLTYCNEHVEE